MKGIRLAVSLIPVCMLSEAALAESEWDKAKKTVGGAVQTITQGATGALNELNPLSMAAKYKTLAEAVASGDSSQTKRALGDVILNTGGCINCEELANEIVPQLTDEQIQAITGEGVMVFYATGDPVLTFLNVSTNTYREVKMVKEQDAPAPFTPRPAERAVKHFKGTPECITSDGKWVYAIWKTSGTLSSDGKSGSFPNLEIQKGDIVSLTSKGECTDNVAGSGARIIQEARIKYEDNHSITSGDPNALKFWIYGSEM